MMVYSKYIEIATVLYKSNVCECKIYMCRVLEVNKILAKENSLLRMQYNTLRREYECLQHMWRGCTAVVRAKEQELKSDVACMKRLLMDEKKEKACALGQLEATKVGVS